MEVRYGASVEVVKEEPLVEIYLVQQGWAVNVFNESHPKLGPGYPEFGKIGRSFTKVKLVSIKHHHLANVPTTAMRQVESESSPQLPLHPPSSPAPAEL